MFDSGENFTVIKEFIFILCGKWVSMVHATKCEPVFVVTLFLDDIWMCKYVFNIECYYLEKHEHNDTHKMDSLERNKFLSFFLL